MIFIKNVKKLALNFFDKEKYQLHLKNLQFYLGLGLKIKKSHFVLEFDQSKWLKPYIEINTQKRIEAEKNGDRWKSILQINEQSCIYRRGYNIQERLVKLSIIQCFQLYVSGYQDIPPLSFTSRYQR